jgi:hypothetical protein
MHNVGFKIFPEHVKPGGGGGLENFDGLITNFAYIVFSNCGVGSPDHCLLGCLRLSSPLVIILVGFISFLFANFVQLREMLVQNGRECVCIPFLCFCIYFVKSTQF